MFLIKDPFLTAGTELLENNILYICEVAHLVLITTNFHKILFNSFRWVVLKKLFQKYIQQWSTFYVQKGWTSQKNKGIKILTYNVHWKNPAPTNGFAVSANRRVKNIHLNSLHLGIVLLVNIKANIHLINCLFHLAFTEGSTECGC